MKNSFLLKSAIAICISIVAVSCNKNTKEEPIGCEPVPAIVLPFNVLEAGTSQNLFFSASPRYQTNSIYFFSTKDKTRKDTIRPMIVGTGTNHVFTVPVTNAAVKQDTLLMKIATNSDDVIIYSIKNETGECSYLKLDKVLLNGTVLTTNQARYSFLK